MHKIEKSCSEAGREKKGRYNYHDDKSILYPGKKFCMGCPVGEQYKKAWVGLGKCRKGGMEQQLQQPSPMKIQIKHDKRRRVMWYKNGTRIAGVELPTRIKAFVMKKYRESRKTLTQQQRQQ